MHRTLPHLLTLTLLFALTLPAAADPGRWEADLSGPGWRLWLDRTADWKTDTVRLPPVDVAALPVNPPTCGWEELARRADALAVSVPGTVEEYCWSANGNPNGIAGDYRGVSWWSTEFDVPAVLAGKRFEIVVESANLRAECFLNGRLVGYDVIGNTPFAFDITEAVRLGAVNKLDIRVTDPVGTFAWDDENMLKWGPNNVPSVHGFGGVTGRVIVRAVDAVRISDIYVRNSPKVREADVFVTLASTAEKTAEKPVQGTLTLTVHRWNDPDAVLWEQRRTVTAAAGETQAAFHVDAPKAELWDIDRPNLYVAAARFESGDGAIADADGRRFGFRWFEVRDVKGDKQFFLNGRRVFLLAAMTRGFWPKNGIFPTRAMAERDMTAARDLGFNMMLYHRAIGQPASMDVADERGVLAYEEPGGYLCNPMPDETAMKWRREKIRRMMIRDRSRPSLVIINMDDLSDKPPVEDDYANIALMHALDPSRITTYNCIIAPAVPDYREDDPKKLHLLPFDDTRYIHGWTSPYHLVRWVGWLDEYYRNPRYYLRYVLDPVQTMGDSINPMPEDEIIFYGEEGGFGTLMRLEAIRNELAVTGADGWRESEHLDWYGAIDRYLDDAGLRSSFPTVDAFTLALGETMHYFHGRAIENVRISNKADAYVINGWATEMTHTDIVDAYRNPTADPAILRHYTQPLYVAVKLRDTVFPVGGAPVADIFLVNEPDLRGQHTLRLTMTDPDGTVRFKRSLPVKIEGGGRFGQLLAEDIRIPALDRPGYFTLAADILDRAGAVRAEGFDRAFAADVSTPPPMQAGMVAVIDTTGTVQRFLSARGIDAVPFDPSGPEPAVLILGGHDFPRVRSLGIPRGTRSLFPIMEIVANGARLIVLEEADAWAAVAGQYYHKAVKYEGLVTIGNGGRLFVGKSPFLAGLPVAQAMNWEYQALYRADLAGLRLDPTGIETIVGLAPQDTDRMLTALARVPFGTGDLFLSTLDLLPALASAAPQAAVPQRLFLNLLEK